MLVVKILEFVALLTATGVCSWAGGDAVSLFTLLELDVPLNQLKGFRLTGAIAGGVGVGSFAGGAGAAGAAGTGLSFDAMVVELLTEPREKRFTSELTLLDTLSAIAGGDGGEVGLGGSSFRLTSSRDSADSDLRRDGALADSAMLPEDDLTPLVLVLSLTERRLEIEAIVEVELRVSWRARG